MSKYWYDYFPDGVESRFESLVFNRQNQPSLRNNVTEPYCPYFV